MKGVHLNIHFNRRLAVTATAIFSTLTLAACASDISSLSSPSSSPDSTGSQAWDDNATPSYYSKTYSRVTDGEVALADKPFSETEPYKVIAILNNQALVVQGKNDDAPRVVYIIDSYTRGLNDTSVPSYNIDPTKIRTLDGSKRDDSQSREGTRDLIAQFLEDRGGIVYLEKDDSVPYEAIINGIDHGLSDKQKEKLKSAKLSWNAHVWGAAPGKRNNLEQELLMGYLAKNGAHGCTSDETINIYSHLREKVEETGIADLPCRHVPNGVGKYLDDFTFYPSKYYKEIDRLAAQGLAEYNKRMGYDTPATEGE